MTPDEGSAINVGAAIREGLELNTVEVVALLHNACLQLDAGAAAALPASIDNLWITDAGTVVLPGITRVEPARATVGLLLETLLPAANAGWGRRAGSATQPPGETARVGQHVRRVGTQRPVDRPAMALTVRLQPGAARFCGARAARPLSKRRPPAAIDMFADEGDAPLPAATAPATAATPATAPAPETAVTQAAAPATALATPPAQAPRWSFALATIVGDRCRRGSCDRHGGICRVSALRG